MALGDGIPRSIATVSKEALIREIDPELSLHCWDWTQSPQN